MNKDEMKKLDSWIAQNVMGWILKKGTYIGPGGKEVIAETTGNWSWINPDGDGWVYNYFRPTEKIEIAWHVVEKISEMGYEISVGKGQHADDWECSIEKGTDEGQYDICEYTLSETAPLAICFTAMKAVIDERCNE